MDVQGVTGKLYTFSTWVYRLAYLNVLWLFFTVIGLGVFGIAPATVASFGVSRKWVKDKDESNIFLSFWQIYKQEFIKSNGIGFILFSVGFALYLNFQLTMMIDNIFMFTVIRVLFLISFFVYFLTVVFIFPVYVHFDLKVLQLLKQSFFIAIAAPLETIITLLLFSVVYFTLALIPGLIPFFGLSLFAFISTIVSLNAFSKLESRISGSSIEV
ncbi:YesL family protein [Pontibacillus sp. HMF3514]|uniref:YesL family protein n=1 Tax=Pontibacillus sp. HMF3514 TaxID=2692425 RepID=UPI00131F86BD|nr:DUF624 domain-containing protein [Pontibacillus sp. HMF3514]QHE53027.1 DUF624 domain-containing protein [Pontibacillus sp. HMF3514]